jgi:hypothetical protein
VQESTKKAVVDTKEMLDKAGITEQRQALCQAAKQCFYNTSKFTLRDLRSRGVNSSSARISKRILTAFLMISKTFWIVSNFAIRFQPDSNPISPKRLRSGFGASLGDPALPVSRRPRLRHS